MLAEIDGVQKLDFAINAALLSLTSPPSRTTMSVCWSSAIPFRRFFARKGGAQVHAILEAVYDLRASLADPDYRGAAGY